MKILVLEKNKKRSRIIKGIINTFEYFENKTYELDIINESCKDMVIDRHYDVYFVRTCKSCLDQSKQFINEQRKKDPKALFIMVSTSDELIYSIQEVHPFYYVRNTLLEEDMVKALELIVKELQKEYVVVVDQNETKKIDVEDIYAVEIDDHYLNIYTKDKEYMIRETITQFVDQYHFIRISRSVAVNTLYIDQRVKNMMHLTNAKQFKISTKYYSAN